MQHLRPQDSQQLHRCGRVKLMASHVNPKNNEESSLVADDVRDIILEVGLPSALQCLPESSISYGQLGSWACAAAAC